MDYLENRTFDEIQIGDSASLTRTLTEKDIQIFAILSGDINPAHVDIEYAQSEMFHEIIGHGMWSAALISTVLGTQLPGPGTIYVGQTLRFKKPVAVGDTLTVTVTVTEKAEKNRVVFACVCHNQRDEVVMEGEAKVIAPTKKIRRSKIVMPEISLRRPHSLFDRYLAKAKKLNMVRTAVIFPVREQIIEAVHDANVENLITPVLIGPKDRIQRAADIAKIDIGHYELINIEHATAAINLAIAMARNSEVGMIVRGGVTREELLKAMLKHDKGLLTDGCMSYALMLDVPTYPKPLILTDTLINTDPNLDTKRAITQNAIDFAHALEIIDPKVAILAGSDMVTSSMRSTTDAAALCKMAERGQITGGTLDGPLTFDNVITTEVAKSQGIHSTVVGNADVVVVPNLETGSILAKQLEYLAESRNAGLVLGGRVPVLMSHIQDVYLSTVSCALAMLNSEYHKRETEKLIEDYIHD